jgi:hypothetical protein
MPAIKKTVKKKSIKITDRGKLEKTTHSRKTKAKKAIKAIMGDVKAEALITDKNS